MQTNNGSPSPTIINLGDFECTSGEIVDDFSNQKNFELKGGRLASDSFINLADTYWSGGTIACEFAENKTNLTIDGPALVLDDSSHLSNDGSCWQESSFTCGESAKLSIKSGDWQLLDTASIYGNEAHLSIDENALLSKRLENGSPTSTSHLNFETIDWDGRLECESGRMEITTDTSTINRAECALSADTSVSITLPSITGSGFALWHIDGLLNVDDSNSRQLYYPVEDLSGNGSCVANIEQSGIFSVGLSEGSHVDNEDIFASEQTDLEIEISGNLRQTNSATTLIAVSESEHSLIDVTKDVELAGTLQIVIDPDFVPDLNASFTIIEARSISGNFDLVEVHGESFVGEHFVVHYDSDTVSIEYVEPEENAIALWVENEFTASEQLDLQISGLSADPDLDGYQNLFEYIFSTSPKDGSSFPGIEFRMEPIPNENQRRPVFLMPNYDSTRTGFNLGVVRITDLTNEEEIHTPVPTTIFEDGTTRRIELPIFNDAQAFFRLKATSRADTPTGIN
tara:strand:- start:4823 stop:6361 length:1539 start_codon:yes stop_codon:yes gene_type:complete